MNERMAAWGGAIGVMAMLAACQGDAGTPEAPPAEGVASTTDARNAAPSSEERTATQNVPVAEGTGEEEDLHAALLPQASVLVGSWNGRWSNRRDRAADSVPVQIELDAAGGLRATAGTQTLTGRWQLEGVEAHRAGHDRMLDARVAILWEGGPGQPACTATQTGVYVLRVNLERPSFVVAEQLAEPCVARNDWWFGATMQRLR